MKRPTESTASKIIFAIIFIMLGFIYGYAIGVMTNEDASESVAVPQPTSQVYLLKQEVCVEIYKQTEPTPTVSPAPALVSKTGVEPQDISRDFNVFQPCGYTYEELSSALSSESHQGFLPYVDTFLEAEETYGVNAFYLMCKLGYESGWGKYMADQNNIGGWTDGRGGFQSFDSVEQCIFHIAENLSTVYRDAVGERLADVCWMYCPTYGYTDTLMQIMRERTYAINENYGG